MKSSQQTLWERLDAFHIGPKNAALSFAERLARENNWSLSFAEQVIVEYKKFLFLIATGNQEFTPSDQVDQVWHLHLTYTRSYWNELCGDVLGFSLHHGPTQGGQEQGNKFRQQYSETLAAYRNMFGEPPSNVWPSVEQRFANADQFIRINRVQLWLINKPSAKSVQWMTIGVSSLLLAACSTYVNEDGSLRLLNIIISVFIVAIIVKWIIAMAKTSKGSQSSGCGTGGCGTGGCGGASYGDSKSNQSESSNDGGSGCGSGCGGCGG